MMMSRCAKVIAVIAAVTCLAACGSSGSDPDPTPPAPGPGTIAGVVSETGTSALIEGATVMYTGGGSTYQTASAADGTYTVDVPAGTYALRAYKGTTQYDDFTQSGVVVVAEVTTTQDVPLTPAATYVGSLTCATAGCHPAIHAEFLQSGHPYKLNPVTGGVAPTYPFSSLAGVDAMITDDGLDEGATADLNGTLTDNTLGIAPGATTWSNLTYVIGGFFWKARFLDAAGYIVTGSGVQYNFATSAMAAYDNNQVDVPYNCGNCHTTGWRHFDAVDNNNRQDGLAGMDGTFEAPGVHCEACHGAGSRHAAAPSPSNITRVASPRTPEDYAHGRMGWGIPAACGDCHTRDGEDDYPTFQSPYNTALLAASKPTVLVGGRIAASGGLVKHHEQYDEILGVDPDTLDSTRNANFMTAHGNCSTCHKMTGAGLGGAHGSTVYQGNAGYTGAPGVSGSNADCMVCHPLNDPTLRTGGMTSLNCVDCHMPKLAKSATSTTLTNTVVVGDVTSHIFRIDVGTTAQQFTGDGAYAYPAITVDWACRTCHGNGGLFDVGASDTFNFHNNK